MTAKIMREEQLPPFANEPLTDFTKPENKAAFQAALDRAKSQLGAVYRCYLDGQWVEGPQQFP